MIEKLDRSAGKMVGYKISGKLHDEDYKKFVPEIEAVIEKEGPVRVLLVMRDFHGWDLHAAWDDLKFDIKHYKDLERIAMVGENKWEEWMTKLSKPFIKGNVRYFDSHELEEAWKWLES
ncbi:hypothetical protein MNBD_DELTA01-654 [hydrothermal vent metagenome]|uniref:STAS/SEC14 domain-containing protein n=1 Tax=hydrothermal vent metagenome TaxID=652676 RepID=A0A3B0RFZ1_9ZZZZ